MHRLEEGALTLSRTPMPSHPAILEDQPDFLHRGDHQQLPMRLLHRHRIDVRVEPHQRLRIGRAVGDPSRFKHLLRQRQKPMPFDSDSIAAWEICL